MRLLAHVAVHDCGRPINPMIVEGQLHGGMVQGIGSALMEELIHDETVSSSPAPSWSTRCRVPTRCRRSTCGHLDCPSAINPLGIKGVGESGIIAPAAAIANAVEDALADHGVEVDRVPLTSARLFEMLRVAAPDGVGLARITRERVMAACWLIVHE